ncbi:MAG: hypothetical protein GC199_09740 [Alphaproteobacteria bacterium]|nr:hypothetical protein [Alphaproteobacteria bacterium]
MAEGERQKQKNQADTSVGEWLGYFGVPVIGPVWGLFSLWGDAAAARRKAEEARRSGMAAKMGEAGSSVWAFIKPPLVFAISAAFQALIGYYVVLWATSQQ